MRSMPKVPCIEWANLFCPQLLRYGMHSRTKDFAPEDRADPTAKASDAVVWYPYLIIHLFFGTHPHKHEYVCLWPPHPGGERHGTGDSGAA